jgi:hypothetical protein
MPLKKSCGPGRALQRGLFDGGAEWQLYWKDQLLLGQHRERALQHQLTIERLSIRQVNTPVGRSFKSVVAFKTVVNAPLSYQRPYSARPHQLGCARGY